MLKEIRTILNKAAKGTEFVGKVYFAGGCVRDELIGRKTRDIDITVELPDGGIRFAEYLFQQGISNKPKVFKQFGTALISIGEHKIELVMTRKESYHYRSRKPDVEFGSLEEDVLRRDFTVNSLLVRISDGEILDLSGCGRKDLEAGLIRATSSPSVIFKEDPLRLLRAIRFATELDFDIEKKTFIQIKKLSSEVKYLSQERIAAELFKIISSPKYIKGLQLLVKSGLKSYVFPGLRLPASLLAADIVSRVRVNSAWVKPPITSLSINGRLVLMLWWNKDKTKYLKLLKMNKNQIRRVIYLHAMCTGVRDEDEHDGLVSLARIRSSAWAIGEMIDEFIVLYPYTGMFLKRGDKTWKRDLELCQKLKRAAVFIEKHRFNLTVEDVKRTFCIKHFLDIPLFRSRALEYWLYHPKADKKELLEFLKKNSNDFELI